MKLDFPYKEGSMSGVFANLLRKKNVFFCNVSLFPESNFKVDNCFDGSASTFCHSDRGYDIDKHYIQVQFITTKFKIEGFAIQNRAEGYWNPLNYELQASNNGEDFTSLKNYSENSNKVCTGSQIRTSQISTNRYFSYFRFTMKGETCSSGTTYFNMGELDLFGTILVRECVGTVKKNRYAHSELFIVTLIVFLGY